MLISNCVFQDGDESGESSSQKRQQVPASVWLLSFNDSEHYSSSVQARYISLALSTLNFQIEFKNRV